MFKVGQKVLISGFRYVLAYAKKSGISFTESFNRNKEFLRILPNVEYFIIDYFNGNSEVNLQIIWKEKPINCFWDKYVYASGSYEDYLISLKDEKPFFINLSHYV